MREGVVATEGKKEGRKEKVRGSKKHGRRTVQGRRGDVS